MSSNPLRESRRRFVHAMLVASATLAASLPAPAAHAAEPQRAGRSSTGARTPSGPSETVAAAGIVLVLGDSLSAEYGLRRGVGWVERLSARLLEHKPSWGVVNASVSGETTAGGRSRIDELLRRHRPQVVVVELGGNDALRGLDLRSTEANLDAIVAASVRANARVLVLGMQVPPNYGSAYADAFAAIFPRVAERHGAALVPFFLAPIAGDMRWFQPDRIHPTEAAQPLLFDTVWPALEPLLRASAPAR